MDRIDPVMTRHPPRLEIETVATWVGAAKPGAARLLAGLDIATLRRRFEADRGAAQRPVFFLDLPARASAPALIEEAIASMARAAIDLWPFWWDGEDWSDFRDDTLGLAHLPIRLEHLAARVPGLSRAWTRQAILRAVRGLPPRAREAAPETDWAQICLALAPSGLVVVAELGADARSEPRARALEWLAAMAPVAVVALAKTLPPPIPPFDRLLHGAAILATGPLPEASEETPAPAMAAAAPMLLAAPEVEGRPHPLSPIEIRLGKMLKDDPELAPLFAFNIAVPGLGGITARVDLAWLEGRVVIELDGPEHRARATYRADRHRDYELLRAGYHVLRIPNEEVSEDYGRALDKIRDIARLRRRG